MSSQRIEDALQLLRAEFLDQPHLCLTSVDVEGLLDLDLDTAEAILQALKDSAFLELTPEGQFRLAHDRLATNQR